MRQKGPEQKTSKWAAIILAVGLVVSGAGCARLSVFRQDVAGFPIIVLPDARDKSSPKKYVMLRIEYGLIISNGDVKSAPSYYLFCRDEKRILKTHDVNVLLAELEKLPDRAAVDLIDKCTVPFYTQYGVNIAKQYKSVMDLLRRKRCKVVTSLEDDERHASFCYCEGGFTILGEHEAGQAFQHSAAIPWRADRGYPYLKQDEIQAKGKIAVSAEISPEEKFRAVWGLAISGYTKESVEALTQVACDKGAGETTRGYAAMGLRNFTGQLPDESRKAIQQRLRAVLESERGNTPDGILRVLIAWDDAPFIDELLGKQLQGHTMEVEVLAALPGKESGEKLWQLYEASRKSYKSTDYNRTAAIGRALVHKEDVRGIDILVDLLPEDHAPGPQYRHNVFVFLARSLNKDFGYKASDYDPALEDAVAKMASWWKKNKGTFVFAVSDGRQ